MNDGVPRAFGPSLEHAILETLAYFDVFDFPVCPEAMHRYLHDLPVSRAGLQAALYSLALARRIETQDGYYVLAGRRSLVDLYASSAPQKARCLHLALQYGRLLSRLPFIRMVAITGSVAMQNGASGADLDYLLVTPSGRVWLGRLFAVALGRWARLQGDILCPNIVLSADSLLWRQRDIYAAHELTQMIPVSGFDLYWRLRALNAWTQTFLPNSSGAPFSVSLREPASRPLQRLLELPLQTALGTALEQFEMNRKIARFKRQPGFGVETVFDPDLCQGNFLNHGTHTQQAFEHRLMDLGLSRSVPYALSEDWLKPAASRAFHEPAAGNTLDPTGYRSIKGPAVAND